MRFMLLAALLSIGACTATEKDWFPEGSPVKVRPHYESGSYLDKLERLPGTIYTDWQTVQQNRLGGPTVSTRRKLCYRVRTLARDVVQLCFAIGRAGSWNWYANPVLICEPGRRAYSASHDPIYWCRKRY